MLSVWGAALAWALIVGAGCAEKDTVRFPGCDAENEVQICEYFRSKGETYETHTLLLRADVWCKCEPGCDLSDYCTSLSQYDIRNFPGSWDGGYLTLHGNPPNCPISYMATDIPVDPVGVIDAMPLQVGSSGSPDVACSATTAAGGLRLSLVLFDGWGGSYRQMWPGAVWDELFLQCGSEGVNTFTLVNGQIQVASLDGSVNSTIPADVVDVRFVRRAPNITWPASVAVVVDRGGAMHGNVDPVTLRETATGQCGPDVDRGWGMQERCDLNASDPLHSRFGAIRGRFFDSYPEPGQSLYYDDDLFEPNVPYELALYSINEFALTGYDESSPETAILNYYTVLGDEVLPEELANETQLVMSFAHAPGQSDPASWYANKYMGTAAPCYEGWPDACGRTPLWTGVQRALEVLETYATHEARHVVVLS
ncbi:MAG: hypothetical protein HUU55_23710, partial [Myxococcales bacterium]|nr:hypothetical protein [Myxococcales bacterium]